MKRRCEEQEKGDSEASLFERLDMAIRNLVGDTTPRRPSPSSKYPPFETKPSSKEWRQLGGAVIDRRMDELRGSDNPAVWAAWFQVNHVRKMDTIPVRIMAGVCEAVEEAEKSVKEEN